MLLNVSNSHLWWQGKDPEEIVAHHRPSLLAFPAEGDIDAAHEALSRQVADAAGSSPDEHPLAKVHEVLEPTQYKSFWDHGVTREVIPVVAKRSYWVPDISDALFWDGWHTAEHDVPYQERALADLASQKDWWLLDTKGKPADLRVLTYDIETTKYGEGTRDVPIDIIGWSDFPVRFESHKDLDTEEMDFRFIDLPNDWQERDVQQLVARNKDEELDNLEQFTKMAVGYDIVAGHNILGFDNKQIHDRIKGYLTQNRSGNFLSPGTQAWFEQYTEVYSRPDSSFHFGSRQETCVLHPVSMDTFHAARKFFFFHDDFSLKGLAPWLGIHVPDRVYMEPAQMDLGPETLAYNQHDIQEQVGVTQNLIAQALPLCFTVNMPLHSLLTGGNTKMWDHMAFIRARREQRMMPATCRAQGVARGVLLRMPTVTPTRIEIAEELRATPPADRANVDKEYLRVVKQGPEMPFWMEHPTVILRRNPADGADPHGYAIPGGMTLKPDSDLQSHFMPWFHVVAADVGAMYPTILKARNLTADTVRPARADEEVDDWLWLFELDDDFIESGKYHVRRPKDEERFAKGRGWMVGVKRSPDPGMVNKAMTGVLDMIQKVKDDRAKAKADGAPDQQVRLLDMTYASLKAARNAGTHGILVAVNVSCRQFNVWGGANITTVGQQILHDALEDFEAKGIRVVYGDTDGIYLACSKSAGNLPHFAAALDADVEPEADKWITMPDDAIAAVDAANTKWRELLNYEGFELEPELHDAMVFVVHKNYLVFDARDGAVKMETKGNNFKGSDKAPLAQNLLSHIMADALKEVASWDDEENAREAMKTAIKRATTERIKGLDVTKADWDDLILRQGVKPVKSYKPNPDGSLANFAVRTAALEQVIGEPIKAGRKFKFVVCRDPLPLYTDPERQREATDRLARQGHRLVVKKPRKSGIKPIEYMWPVEHVDRSKIDWVWYKDMVEAYVKGAFGFDSLELAVQRDLSSWF